MNLPLSTEKYNTNCYNLKTYRNDNPWKNSAAFRSKQTPKMDLLAEIVNNLKAGNYFAKSSTSDVWLDLTVSLIFVLKLEIRNFFASC